MHIVDPKAQAYAEYYSSPNDELLQQVEEFTNKHHPHAHMLSGQLQGKFLEMISCAAKPVRVLEVGTFTGYSALCLAKGLQPSGILHTVEVREEDAETAQNFFRRSSYAEQIILHIGNALDIVGQLREEWDLVFIDADKTNYSTYFNLIFPRVKVNGFILADNVLFHGEVLTEKPKGKSAKAIQAFNDFIRERTDIEKLMLPLRDGLYVLRKLR